MISVPNEDMIMPLVFVVVMIGAGLLHIIPPETNKCKLPATLQEANAIRYQALTTHIIILMVLLLET